MMKALRKNWISAPIRLMQDLLNADPFTYSAALAYYALFSLPALLLVLVSVSALIYGNGALQSEIGNYFTSAFGENHAQAIGATIERSSRHSSTGNMLTLGFALLIFGALRIFLQLQKTLNHIWHAHAQGNAHVGWRTLVARRIISFSVLLLIGITLLVSVMLTSLINSFQEWLSQYFTPVALNIFQLADLIISFATIAALFAWLLKILPDRHVRWRYALRAGVLAAVMFLLGEYLLGWYFSTFNPQSGYGVAGAFILFMLWVYYTSMIFFFCAFLSSRWQYNARAA